MADLCPHCGAKLPAIRDAFCSECRGDLAEAPLEPKPYSGRESVSETPNALAAGLWHATEERLFQWVKLSWYLDAQDEPVRAYFTTASMLERWTGGAKRLCALLRRTEHIR
jgi:hypothetical protein